MEMDHTQLTHPLIFTVTSGVYSTAYQELD